MQEVGGSIPPGSTSLRSLRELRLGKPHTASMEQSERRLPRRSPQGVDGPAKFIQLVFGEHELFAVNYVYILESLDGEHFYIGLTDDLRARLAKHNAGEVSHTSKFRPWRLKTYIAFSDPTQAVAFEKYLKSGSGRAFAKKRF